MCHQNIKTMTYEVFDELSQKIKTEMLFFKYYVNDYDKLCNNN